MTYRIRESYGEEARGRTLQTYDDDSLQREQKWAEEDLEEIKKFLEAVKIQREKVVKIVFETEVSLHRERNYSTKHINFKVNVYQVPKIPGGEKIHVYRLYNEGKIFPSGHDKKAAIEYARELSRKYGGCRIVGDVITKTEIP